MIKASATITLVSVYEELGEITDMIISTTSELSTRLDNTDERITAEASRIDTTITQLSTTVNENKSAIDVRFDEINLAFSNTETKVTQIDGAYQTFYEEFSRYISFSGNPDEPAITIGTGNNSIQLTIDNERGIIFSNNGVEFGSWDGTNFHTGNILIDVNEKAQFGNFAFIPRSDGSLSFLKVGG